MNQLQLAMQKFYRSHVYRGMPVSTAVQPIKDAIADHDIKLQAFQRLNELKKLDEQCGGRLSMRCFVSNIEKRGLEEALSG